MSRLPALNRWLESELARLGPGDRLPTVRQMMRTFRTSQRNVQAALAPFVADGRLRVKRGAGIVVAAPAAAEDEGWDADVLLLYRVSDSRLARNLILEIERRMKAAGITMMLLGFTNEDHALSLLSRLGRFRVCLLQAHFGSLQLQFLAALASHSSAVLVDGISTTGVAVDGIGTNWREALGVAFRHLQDRGHPRIGFLTSAHPARQIAMARREYLRLCEASGAGAGWLIELDALPGSYAVGDIERGLRERRGPDGNLPFTALITWGVVEGYLLERALANSGMEAGRDISVIMLGSVDFPSEHLGHFDTVGNSNAEKIDLFERVIRMRLTGGGAAPDIHYLPIHLKAFGSVYDCSG